MRWFRCRSPPAPAPRSTTKTNAQLAAQVALEKQRQAALTNSASAQARFQRLPKASNSRQACPGAEGSCCVPEGRQLPRSTGQTVARNQQVAAINKVSQAQMAYARGAGSQYGKDVNVQALANQRYALYDVARAWTFAAGATLGFSAAVIKVGIDIPEEFSPRSSVPSPERLTS
jgi:hypothetical protein